MTPAANAIASEARRDLPSAPPMGDLITIEDRAARAIQNLIEALDDIKHLADWLPTSQAAEELESLLHGIERRRLYDTWRRVTERKDALLREGR